MSTHERIKVASYELAADPAHGLSLITYTKSYFRSAKIILLEDACGLKAYYVSNVDTSHSAQDLVHYERVKTKEGGPLVTDP